MKCKIHSSPQVLRFIGSGALGALPAPCETGDPQSYSASVSIKQGHASVIVSFEITLAENLVQGLEHCKYLISIS